MNQLAKYLKNRKVSQSDFAAQINRHQTLVSRLASGKNAPDIETAKRIDDATEGAVKFIDWPKFAAVIEAAKGQSK